MYQKNSSKPLQVNGNYSPVAIDPGSSLIKAIQLQEVKGQIKISGAATLPAPTDLYNQGLLTEHSKLVAALKEIKSLKKWRGREISLSLNPRSFYLTRISMPPMKKSDLDRAMRWEMEKRFAIPAEQAIFSYCPVNPEKDHYGTESDYLLAAVSAATAKLYSSAAEQAGLKLISLEAAPLALIRMAAFSHTDKTGGNNCSLLIDLGRRSTTLVITYNHCYTYYRSLQYTVNPADSTSQQNLYRAIGRSVDYWQEQGERPDRYPTVLRICGGGTAIPGLAGGLARYLKIKPSLLCPPFNYLPEASDKNSSRADQVRYTLACGLALGGWTT